MGLKLNTVAALFAGFTIPILTAHDAVIPLRQQNFINGRNLGHAVADQVGNNLEGVTYFDAHSNLRCPVIDYSAQTRDLQFPLTIMRGTQTMGDFCVHAQQVDALGFLNSYPLFLYHLRPL